MENNKEKVYEDDKHFADSNNRKKNNNVNVDNILCYLIEININIYLNIKS